MEPAHPGMCVVTPRGYRLGVVLEVGNSALRIELLRPADADVWVQDEAVFTVDGNGRTVTLICEEEGLHRYVVGSGYP